MKKVYLFFLLSIACLISNAQTSDTLIRSTGFFISPAVTGLHNNLDTVSSSPRFGLSVGYRFVNKMKYGIFIESGLNYTWLGAKYPTRTINIMAYGKNWTYSENGTANLMFLNVPFLAGYKMSKGKVRFQGSLGFSVDLKFSDYKIIHTTGSNPFSVTPKSSTGDILTFGTGISAIIKAGISVPLTERMTLDIIPSARWQFASFNRGSMDFFEDASAKSKNSK